MTEPIPLRLTFEPILVTRTPGPHGCFEYGFRLRLPEGPLLDPGDPLLAAYGCGVTAVVIDDDDDEQAQHDGFDPGSRVRLVPEPGEDGDLDVGVWDRDGERRAGSLPDRPALVISTAIDFGLSQSAVVLDEDRSPSDDRRCGLTLFVCHDHFVTVDASATNHFTRPTRVTRPRLVLVADGTGDVRWWDPTAAAGPIAADDLPMSADLTRAMQRLREAYGEMADDDAGERRGFERFEADLDRDALDREAAALWKRARAELGRRFAVGFLGAGMERPVWSPAELEDDAGCSDMPF